MRVLLHSALVAGVAVAALTLPLTLPLTLASAARAETLGDALSLAYDTNPALLQQRAQQRALDETYVQARAGLRPRVSATAAGDYSRLDLPTRFGGAVETRTASLTLAASQTLFSGGRTAAAISAAEADILAGREGLRAAEAGVLLQVVSAYADVRRDQAIVGIREENVAVLKSQLDEVKAKFEAGQLTRTDVAQAEAQYAQARGLLTSSQAQLQISRAGYAATVGRAPGELAPAASLPGLPAQVDEAFDLADHDAPAVRQAVLTERADRARVDEAKAANHAQLAATASFGPTDSALSTHDLYSNQVTAGLTLTQPLFTGGLNSSLIRQALEHDNASRIEIEKQRRAAVQAVSQAWSAILSARANLDTDQEQVKAAKVAFEGAQAEYRVGRRITLDVLQAEQQVRDAELALAQAEHDGYVAEAQLLAAVGRLEGRFLLSGRALYDPAASFAKLRNAGGTPLDLVSETVDGLARPHSRAAAPPR